MIVQLSPVEIERAEAVARERNENAIRANADPHKHGFVGNNLQIHIEGALAEMAAAKALGLKWDDGPWRRVSHDVGELQIRSTTLPTGKLIIRPVDADDDIFVLVIADDDTFELKGWIKARDGKQERFKYDKNQRDTAYFIPQFYLTHMRLLVEQLSCVK